MINHIQWLQLGVYPDPDIFIFWTYWDLEVSLGHSSGLKKALVDHHGSWDPLYLGDYHCIIHEVGTPMRTNLQKVTSQACMIIRWLIIIVIDQDISQYTPTTTYHNTLPTINYSSFVNGNFPMLSRRFSQIKLDFMAPYPGWNQIWTEPGSRPHHACGLWGAWWTTSFWSMGMGQNLSPIGPEILVLYMFSVNMYWPCNY